MIFPELKAGCRERFLEVSTFLGFISNLEPSPEAIEPTSIEVKVLRGLFCFASDGNGVIVLLS